MIKSMQSIQVSETNYNYHTIRIWIYINLLPDSQMFDWTRFGFPSDTSCHRVQWPSMRTHPYRSLPNRPFPLTDWTLLSCRKECKRRSRSLILLQARKRKWRHKSPSKSSKQWSGLSAVKHLNKWTPNRRHSGRSKGKIWKKFNMFSYSIPSL